MSVSEARRVLEEAYAKFQVHIKVHNYSRAELAKQIGTSEVYVSRLINGQEKGKAAKDKLRTLFKYTNYQGENWLV
ncbi:helix-turn-helix domain-containing protein [Lactobacillaceae bacterium KNUT 0156]|nr:helix-turn-helix domain-containing protein [Weissella cibaria]